MKARVMQNGAKDMRGALVSDDGVLGDAALAPEDVSPEAVSPAVPSRAVARPVWVWAALAAALISLPSLLVGFSGDDLVHRLVLEGQVPGYALGPLELYDFTPPRLPSAALIDQGMFPWFASPELSLRFLRPLSSASLWLDHASFGRDALLSHLQSVFWMAVLAGVAASLYQRWFTRGAAMASALVFAISTVHGTPTAWLAARHTLLGASFAVLALWAWVRYREDNRRAFAPCAPAFLLASLLASESGLVGVVLLVSYEVARRGVRRGLMGAAPFLIIGAGYLAAYASLGYGARGSSFYVSPFEAPLDYLGISLWSVPALCAELLLAVPSAIASFMLEARAAIVLAGLAASAGLAAILVGCRAALSAEARRTLAWLAAGCFIGLFALVGAPVTGRVLPLPAFGAAALVGNALWLAWARARRRVQVDAGGPARRFNAWWGAVLLLGLLHLGVSPLLRVGVAFQFRQMALNQKQLAEQADVGACGERGSLYLLTGSDPTLTLYTAAALRFHTPSRSHAERLRVLGMAPQAVRLERVGPRALSLQVLDSPRRENAFERLYRPKDDPLVLGHELALAELAVHVEAVSAGLFERARFDFESDLEGMPACLLAWRAGRLTAVPLPALGESVTLPHEPGPMGM